MTKWDDLVDPARIALEKLITEGDAMTDRVEELEAQRDELLEALEFLVVAASGEGPPVPERELLQDCVDKARAALAKAKGR